MISSFEPIVNKNCKILILGTMPGIKSLQKQEYYGHERNTFWKIIFLLFNEELNINYSYKKKFLLKNNIALWDVLKSCNREGSSDSNIKNPIPNNIKELLVKYPNIKSIYFNGESAEKLFKRIIKNTFGDIDISFNTLPSTSPANTIKFEKKYEKWKKILLGIEGNILYLLSLLL